MPKGLDVAAELLILDQNMEGMTLEMAYLPFSGGAGEFVLLALNLGCKILLHL